MRKIVFSVFLAFLAMVSQAAIQYWDGTGPGLNHSDGIWSTADAQWAASSAGATTLAPWTNASDAEFSAFGGASTVTLSTSLTSATFKVKGSVYSIIVTNGGRLYATGVASIGMTNNCNGNKVVVVGGAGVTSSWSAATTINVGGAISCESAANNMLIVDGRDFPGSAVVTNAATGFNVGVNNSPGNEVQVLAGGRLFTTVTVIGSASTGNTLRVQGTNSLWHAGSTQVQVGAGVGSLLNKLVVEAGAVATNLATTTVPCSSNEVQVLSGGRLFTGGATLGYNTVGARGNIGHVSGSNSLWKATSMIVGGAVSAVFNRLLIDDRAAASCGALSVGTGAAGMNNDVQVLSGGQLACSSVQIGGPGGISNSVLVQGAGSLLTATSSLNPGKDPGAQFNTVVVDLGAVIRYSNFLYVGLAGANSNEVQVLGGGQLINVGGQVSTIGTSSTGNVVRVQGSNSLWNVGAQDVTVGLGAGAMLNALVIDGQGVTGAAVVSNTATLLVGSSSSCNSLMITNGGLLAANGAVNVGSGGWSNQLSIIGDASATSVLNGGNQIITVGGANGTNNVLLVDGQGTLGAAMITNASQLNFGTGTNGTVGNLIRFVNGGVGYIGSATIAMPGTTLGAAILYPAYDNSFEILDGARVYSAGMVAVAYSGKANTHSMARNRLLVRGSESLLALNGSTLMVGGDVTGGIGISNNECRIDGGLVTNVGAVQLAYNPNASPVINGGSLTITNGGRLYSTGASIVSTTTASTGNVITVTGASSLWKLGNQSLTIGFSTTSSSNLLVIDKGGLVDDISTLSVLTNNNVNLMGGTLGVATWTLNNGSAFTVGDGAQAATLKSLAGGTLAFNVGLLINTNATLTGVGIAGGGSVGVTLGNSAAIAPGLGGVGALTIAGTGITFQAGSTCQCEIVDLDLGPGVGWDLVTVTGQVVLAGGGGSQTIKLSSRGAAPAHFDAGRNYNIRLLSYGKQSGDNLAAMTLDTTDFLASGTWSLTNVSSSLYLIYRGGPASATPDYKWNVPNCGNWSTNGNWQGGIAPATGGNPSWVLAFGDNGTPYASTNDRTGNFLLNQMQFAGTSLTTNFIKGNQLVFTNAGAKVDFQTAAGGTFVVSNNILASSDLEFGGNAFAGTLALGGVVTNMGAFTKKGAYTLALSAANDFRGALVVDSPDGTLRLDNVNALNGSGPVTLSNGTVSVNLGAVSYYYANGQHNRRGLVTGRGSVWTNTSTTANNQSGIALGSTNVSFVVDGATMAWNVRFHAFGAGAANSSLIVTNGGQLLASSYASFLHYTSTNCTTVITGTNSLFSVLNNGCAFADAIAVGNVFRVENGALATNMTSLTVANAGSKSNSMIIASGGKFYASSTIIVATGAGTSSNTLQVTGLNSFLRSDANITYIGGSGANDNRLVVDNGGQVSIQRIYVSDGCTGNVLKVNNGGRLIHKAGGTDSAIGANRGAISNEAVVTDQGSEWNLAAAGVMISTGNTSCWNRLTISNNGLVTNVTTISLADGIASSNNSLVVNGGYLYATKVSYGNLLPNTVKLDGAAQVVLTSLALTNVNQSLLFNGGTLSVKSLTISNTLEFVVGDGTQSATLNAQAGGTNLFAAGLVITNNAILGGSGYILATSTVYGAVSPGLTGVGALTNNGPLTMVSGASARFDVIATTAGGCDLLAVTNGALTLTGTLMPVLQTGFVPAKTDRFLIMTNQGPDTITATGGFANGSRATIYADNLKTRVGTFKVETGLQGVVLTDFQVIRDNGSVIVIR